MKSTEFDNLTPEGLKGRVAELKAEYYAKRSAVASGQEKNSAALKKLRRTIAHGLTRLSSKSAKKS